MYITREEAVKTLYNIINSGIISDELEGKLQDIASCIDNEEQGLFTWGADDWEQHCNEIWKKYRIKEEE